MSLQTRCSDSRLRSNRHAPKLIARLALILLTISLVGCGKGKSDATDSAAKTAANEKPAASDAVEKEQPRVVSFKPGSGVQEAVQEELILAEPGTVIQFEAGVFEFTVGLSLDVENVTIRGAGMEKTILSFKNQEAGAEGLHISSDRVLVEDLAIVDTKGNALKSHTANDIIIRRVRAEWTGGPKTSNGAYGIYPVNSTNVLIEECVAIGASDAGIYVGQSKNIIIRNCSASYNVAGIEVENCYGGEVYGNTATKNTGGILVFDLPDLPMQRGHDIRIHHNKVFDNNTPNFAPKGNIVGSVMTGTGIMIMANENIEVFENDIRDHNTVNILINSYLLTGIAINDPLYNPFPERIHIHGNTFGPCGGEPGGDGGKFITAVLGTPLPDILWDGVINHEKYGVEEANPGLLICIHDNRRDEGEVTFANLGGAATLLDPSKAEVTRDLALYAGEMPAVESIKIEGATE